MMYPHTVSEIFDRAPTDAHRLEPIGLSPLAGRPRS